jgi:hypothetical protein
LGVALGEAEAEAEAEAPLPVGAVEPDAPDGALPVGAAVPWVVALPVTPPLGALPEAPPPPTRERCVRHERFTFWWIKGGSTHRLHIQQLGAGGQRPSPP